MCYFSTGCDFLKNREVLGSDIFIELQNGNITIEWKNLIFNGTYFSPNRIGERCYLGMFRGDTLLPGEWIIGANAMQDYYFVYDLAKKMDTQYTPPREYRSIGIARKNPIDVIRQIHYNTTYSGYKSDPNDVSYSIAPTNPSNDDDQWLKEHLVLVISVSAVFLLLIVLTFFYSKNKKSSTSKN